MSNNNHILFKEFGYQLISRMHSRSICLDLLKPIDKKEVLVLDFQGVSVVTLSFITELLANLEAAGVKDLAIENANDMIDQSFQFAMNNMNFSGGIMA